ncbi:hypothetical protein DSL72_005175 [Monilinia vaccinii-corymbosi]|uniref:AP-2 complex subunit sigma n=1 Tax=Monilinia vaccinii-corymbosi TaxID=61207 RepID=A0A8A3PEG9_9HELO|nr:hypothetical protein DSL72_005175 [Monilinia vaccinii-corymbosi]
MVLSFILIQNRQYVIAIPPLPFPHPIREPPVSNGALHYPQRQNPAREMVRPLQRRREDQAQGRSKFPIPIPSSHPPDHHLTPPCDPQVHRLVAPRDQKYQSNFVEFRNNKIVYRRYAGLFFCACVDANDNELAYLEAIHFFVEVLDSFFGNVCELDLVFNFYKVYAILDEVFLAGEIEETSKQVVLTRLEHLDKLE